MRKKSTSCFFLWCIVLLLAPFCLHPQDAPSMEGHWEGTIDVPGTELGIFIDFSQKPDGSWEGKISIPAQNARNLPLSGISFVDNKTSFAIADVAGEPTFNGTLSDDGAKISGHFTQAGQSFSFSLSREVSPKIKAQKALAGFDEIVERGLEELNVPGAALAVVKDDAVILAKGYGLRDVENEKPMTADTILAIGSASKAFTTFAMGVLVDEGKLEWEKPVNNYIPWFRMYDLFASQRLTPRDLVTHRSGLPRHDLSWYNNYQATREEFVRRLAYLEPTADLREKFQYNNLMFLTAGYLVEVLTGKKWENAIRTHVFEPLGMKRTNFSVLDSQKDADHALPYREREGKIEKIPFRDISNLGPAGSINSSVNEMSHWLMVHLNGGKFEGEQIIGPQTIQDMHMAHMPTGGTPVIAEVTPADYGLGWFVDSYRGHPRVHHGGNIDGFSALVSMLPQDGLGMVVLVNKNGSALTELLIRHAYDLVLGAEPKDWIGDAAKEKTIGEKVEEEARGKKGTRRKSGTKPAHNLEEYAGDYFNPGYGDLKVSLDNGKIFFTFNGIRTPLEHWHYETFNAKRAGDPTFEDMKLTFRTDVNGNVAALEVPFEPSLDEIKFEKKPDARLFDPGYLKKFVGKYQLATQALTIGLKGNSLTLFIPGGNEMDLVPQVGDEFILKQVKVVSLSFKFDDEGDVVALELYQPDGVYEAKRIDD